MDKQPPFEPENKIRSHLQYLIYTSYENNGLLPCITMQFVKHGGIQPAAGRCTHVFSAIWFQGPVGYRFLRNGCHLSGCAFLPH